MEPVGLLFAAYTHYQIMKKSFYVVLIETFRCPANKNDINQIIDEKKMVVH